MNDREWVTDFKLIVDGEPCIVADLIQALNRYLKRIHLQPGEYGFDPSPRLRIPKKFRWLVAFTVEGNAEGYYIHVAAIDGKTPTITDLGMAKTMAPDNAYALARGAQRFLTASMWN